MEEGIVAGAGSETNTGEEEPLYEVKYCSELGRYLVAVRDIRAREIIIREDPLISGPCDRGPKELPVCLGCCATMYTNRKNRCTTCHWPVCSEKCEKLAPHAQNECQIFRRNRVAYPPPHGWPVLSKTIFILRCLLLKSLKPREWDRLMTMSDNRDFRRGRPNCINMDKKIVENFQKFFENSNSMVTSTKDVSGSISSDITTAAILASFSDEEVIRISGIIDVNAHAFPLKVNGRSTLTLTIRANVPIRRGDMICVAYDEGQLLVCTLKRLIPNEINGMFICKCRRCLDPTELGTYIGAVKCPSCVKGYLLPVDPVDSFSFWECDGGENQRRDGNCSDAHDDDDKGSRDTSDPKDRAKRDGGGGVGGVVGVSDCDERGNNRVTHCNAILDDESVVDIIEDAEVTCGYTKIDLGTDPPPPERRRAVEKGRENEPDETLELLKEFERDYAGTILHPNHYVLLEVSVRILKREYRNLLSNLGDVELIQYLQRCEKLLNITNVLTPGYCEYRGKGKDK